MSDNYVRDLIFYDILTQDQTYNYILHRCYNFEVEKKCVLELESSELLPEFCPINRGSKVYASIKCLTCDGFSTRDHSYRCYDCDFCESRDPLGQLL